MKSKGGKNKMAITRQDQVRRSKQNWERGRGAKRKGNPRYKPKRVKGKDDVIRKIYVLRGRK